MMNENNEVCVKEEKSTSEDIPQQVAKEPSQQEEMIEQSIVFVLTINKIDLIESMINHFDENVRKLEGIVNVKCTINKENVYIVIFCKNKTCVERVEEYCNGYLKNSDGCQNHLNANLTEMGIVSKYLILESAK